MKENERKLKENERKMIEKLNEAYPFTQNLVMPKYEYNRFDAYNDQYIIEVKDRETDYPSLMIEFDKYTYNKEFAKIQGSYFWYVVKTDKIYVFDITGIDASGYNYRWGWRKMPKTTKFGEKILIDKYVGYIDKCMAIGVIEP